MRGAIGYYVHHHGDGHRQRAIAIGHALGQRITLVGTGLAGRSDRLPVVELPDDRLDENFTGIDEAYRPAALHYAPFDHEGIRQRTALLTHWIAQARPSILVAGVSVEIAMLARLASVPTVYVRLSGKRVDEPHLEAFRGATALLAPFHEALDDDQIPHWIRAKTFYAPGIVGACPGGQPIEDDVVLVVLGRGGGVSNGDRWASAARAVPARRWRIIGPCTVPTDPPANLELRGWVDDATTLIASAGLVVGAAGDGVVSAVIAARRPFICLPEPRPFDEQVSKAKRLAALGVAIVWPDGPSASEWPRLLDEAQSAAPAWPTQHRFPSGRARVAQWLATLAVCPPQTRSNRA